MSLRARLSSTSLFFFSSRRRHTRFDCDWSSDVCSSDLYAHAEGLAIAQGAAAALVDRKFRVDQVAVLLDQDARADVRRIDQLLVGREREDDVAVRLEALLDVFDKVGDEDRHHRLVVDGAAAAEEALHFLPLERVAIPVLALGLDHVEVAEQEDRLHHSGAATARLPVYLPRAY